jgi:hypothetical protein
VPTLTDNISVVVSGDVRTGSDSERKQLATYVSIQHNMASFHNDSRLSRTQSRDARRPHQLAVTMGERFWRTACMEREIPRNKACMHASASRLPRPIIDPSATQRLLALAAAACMHVCVASDLI